MPRPKGVSREFLILEVGDVRATGASFVLRGVADSEAKAKQEVEKLAVAISASLAIVETIQVFAREPVVRVKSVGQSIVPAKP